MISRIFDSSKIIEKSLDACWLRDEVISQNISNIDTPGYKRKTVSFEEYLGEALNRNNRKRINGPGSQKSSSKVNIDDIDIRVNEDNNNFKMRLDGNNVDVDVEMASLAKNSIKYNVLVQSMNAGFRRLKSVISEGRR